MKRGIAAMRVGVVAALVLCLAWTLALAQAPFLEATVRDIGGKPVEGAKLFLYVTPDVRRPADYLSPPSDRMGKLRMPVSPGTYWAVARHKQDDKFGPLMPGDRSSGEPVEIEVKPGTDFHLAFTVADIRELGQMKSAHAADSVKVTGRVVDGQGNHLTHAYVYAHASREVVGIPDYISPWTDDQGNYLLYVPKGKKYFLGASTRFPPDSTLQTTKELETGASQIDIAIPVDLIIK